MIIDFHTHVFPDKMAEATIKDLEQKSGLHAATNGCVKGLLTSMDEARVTKSVILPVVTAPRQFEGINRFAVGINENPDNNGRLISFGGIHPDCDDYKEQLNILKKMGFQGIKLHPDYQGVFFNDIRYKRIVSYASELGLLISVHAGIDIGIPEPVRCTPAMSAEVLKDTESDKLILAHLGGWKMWNEVEDYLVGSKAYLDTSFIQQFISDEQFERIVASHGVDKILFATDCPWDSQERAVKWLQQSSLSMQDKDRIFFENAIALLDES